MVNCTTFFLPSLNIYHPPTIVLPSSSSSSSPKPSVFSDAVQISSNPLTTTILLYDHHLNSQIRRAKTDQRLSKPTNPRFKTNSQTHLVGSQYLAMSQPVGGSIARTQLERVVVKIRRAMSVKKWSSVREQCMMTI